MAAIRTQTRKPDPRADFRTACAIEGPHAVSPKDCASFLEDAQKFLILKPKGAVAISVTNDGTRNRGLLLNDFIATAQQPLPPRRGGPSILSRVVSHLTH